MLSVAAVAFGVWFMFSARDTERLYDALLAQTESAPTVVETATIGSSNITIPNWQLFHSGNMWDLVSKNAKLGKDFVPVLTDAPVQHTAGEIKVAKNIAGPLQAMFRAAEARGVELMLSSAYRSYDEQQATYDSYLELHGKAYVASYVAPAGASEHQTGLAVDIATKSSSCAKSSNDCSLDYASTAWLANNAPTYGFIQRYPGGKQSITGIAGETWHYRYVGARLSRVLDDNNLTFDEFVEQVAPGYGGSRR